VSHRTVERIIGCLLTDEELRLKFMRFPGRTLAELSEQGWELSRLEIEALLATDIKLWSVVAGRIDSRLRRRSTLEIQNDDA
jgi:hypothetical protein